MNGLDMSINLSFLSGRELASVSVGLFQVTFGFDEGVSISIESEYELWTPESSCKWRRGAPDAAASALRLLGTVVERVSGKKDGTLELTFSNGHRLTILDSNREHESFHITRPGGVIVV
jgi:hypothetical protein